MKALHRSLARLAYVEAVFPNTIWNGCFAVEVFPKCVYVRSVDSRITVFSMYVFCCFFLLWCFICIFLFCVNLWGHWFKWQLLPSLPVPVFLIKYFVLGQDAKINWTEHSTTSTSWSQHHFVAIGKAQAACAQSFALWQQPTTEFTCHDHSPRTLVITFNSSQVSIGRACTPRSLYYWLFTPRIYIVVIFFAHIPFVVNHTINTTPPERLQQYHILFMLAANSMIAQLQKLWVW